jgi:putative ABC transport system permease protein
MASFFGWAPLAVSWRFVQGVAPLFEAAILFLIRPITWIFVGAVPLVILVSLRSLPWTSWMLRGIDQFTFWLILIVAEALLFLLAIAFDRGLITSFRFAVKSLFRNLLRSILTALAVIVLGLAATLVVTILQFIDRVMAGNSSTLNAIASSRWDLPSQMPPSYIHTMEEGAATKPTDVKPTAAMSWTFYGGTINKEKPSRENFVFFFATNPRTVTTMLPDMDLYTAQQRAQIDQWAQEMIKDKRKVILGQERLWALNKRVGERIKVTSFNYKDIDLEVEIIGTLPPGRYGQVGVMNSDYFYDAILNQYPRDHNNTAHPMADKCFNLAFLRVPNMNAFNKVAEQVEGSPAFTQPAVKVETESSGVAAFLESYRSLLDGVRYLATPAMLITMVVIIATAISISVRERRKEMAILKVLGFGPRQILGMVLAEAVLVGGFAGFLSTAIHYLVLQQGLGGIPFPIAWFSKIPIPVESLAWGPLLGGTCALVGSLIPAWLASRVKVADVFAKTA